MHCAVPGTHNMKLNIGAGDTKIEGFLPIDRKFGQEAFPLPFQPNSIEEIRCAHMLEHLSFSDVMSALKDWYEKLKPGGRVRIAVPDVDRILNSRHDPGWHFYLMGGQINENDFHKSCFTKAILTAYMQRAGFVDIAPWDGGCIDSASLPISLNLEGYKVSSNGNGKTHDETPDAVVQNLGAFKESRDIKIAACIGVPRIGWNDHWGCVEEALRPWNIPLHRHTGAFWGHNIQTVIERLIAIDVDWALTLDYDSMFTSRDISRLFEIMGENPHIDAVSALQTRRGCQQVLCSNGESGVETDMKTPFKARTAHFGLTLIRLERLKELPKPWFWDQPSASGSWSDDDRVDADIYFWREWEKHGRTLYIAPDVRIGHLEVMVSYMDDDLAFKQMHVQDWWNSKHRKHGNCLDVNAIVATEPIEQEPAKEEAVAI